MEHCLCQKVSTFQCTERDCSFVPGPRSSAHSTTSPESVSQGHSFSLWPLQRSRNLHASKEVFILQWKIPWHNPRAKRNTTFQSLIEFMTKQRIKCNVLSVSTYHTVDYSTFRQFWILDKLIPIKQCGNNALFTLLGSYWGSNHTDQL